MRRPAQISPRRAAICHVGHRRRCCSGAYTRDLFTSRSMLRKGVCSFFFEQHLMNLLHLMEERAQIPVILQPQKLTPELPVNHTKTHVDTHGLLHLSKSELRSGCNG